MIYIVTLNGTVNFYEEDAYNLENYLVMQVEAEDHKTACEKVDNYIDEKFDGKIQEWFIECGLTYGYVGSAHFELYSLDGIDTINS